MHDDHPFREAVREAGIVLRIPAWIDVPALTGMWEHSTAPIGIDTARQARLG